MLDFYLINDNQSKPSYPEQANLKFVGALDEKTFGNLLDKKVIDSRFDYYSDFRLGISMVKQLLDTISKRKINSDIDIQPFVLILNLAFKNNSGLIAYAD